jgi:hypothetical protein
MKTTVSPATIARWEARRDARIAELKKGKPTVRGSQIVVIE